MGTREAMGRLPAFMWMDAREVALQGFEAVMRGDPMIVNGWLNRLVTLLCILLPDALVNAFRPKVTRQGF